MAIPATAVRATSIGVLSLVIAACAPNVHEERREYSNQGTLKKEEVRTNQTVESELHRVLDAVVVEGRGRYKHQDPSMARNIALNLAINDLAKAAGEVLVEEDSTLYNEQVRMIIRTRARNIVSGYEVTVDTYEPETQTAEVIVRQEGERIASEMERYIENP